MREGTIGRRRRALASGLVVVALSGCAGFGPALRVPDDSTVCGPDEGGLWFGAMVQNVAPRPITLAGARLGEAEGATLLDTVAIPEITLADGSSQLLGTVRDPATDAPELWAHHQPVTGFVLPPGEKAAIGFRLTRAPGADVADVASQDIAYRVEGEFLDRTETSRLRLVLAADCDAIG